MKISPEAIIAPEKLRDYLLKLQEVDDKSQFLAQGGFLPEAAEALDQAIRELVATPCHSEAMPMRSEQCVSHSTSESY